MHSIDAIVVFPIYTPTMDSSSTMMKRCVDDGEESGGDAHENKKRKSEDANLEGAQLKSEGGDQTLKSESASGDESLDDESDESSWTPSSVEDDDEEACDGTQYSTRSRGQTSLPPSFDDVNAVMDKADEDVDNESDISSDTEEDTDEESDEESDEEEEESDSDDSEYSDDDSFVTSDDEADPPAALCRCEAGIPAVDNETGDA